MAYALVLNATYEPIGVVPDRRALLLVLAAKAISLEGRAFGIACGQIDIGNAATELSAGIGHGALQPDGSVLAEPMMDVRHAADTVVHMASLPLDANVQFVTIMATNMPLVGRG